MKILRLGVCILVVTAATLCTAIGVSPLTMPHIPSESELASQIALAKRFKGFDQFRNWTCLGVSDLQLKFEQSCLKSSLEDNANDSLVSFIIEYSMPSSYSKNHIPYSCQFRFQFRNSTMSNEDTLSSQCEGLVQLIERSEEIPGVRLFIERTRPSSGKISLWGKTFDWFSQQDSLTYCYRDTWTDFYPNFTFCDSGLLDNLEGFMSATPHPQTGEFRENSGIGFAKVVAENLYVRSSIVPESKSDYYTTGYNGIRSFRLHNSKKWTTFPEFSLAHIALRGDPLFLKSKCVVDRSDSTGVCVYSTQGDDWTQTSKRVIIATRCSQNGSLSAYSIPIGENNVPGDATEIDPSIIEVTNSQR
jgi:hypothetical protein